MAPSPRWLHAWWGCPAASSSINPNLQCYEWLSSTSVTVDVRRPAHGGPLRNVLGPHLGRRRRRAPCLPCGHPAPSSLARHTPTWRPTARRRTRRSTWTCCPAHRPRPCSSCAAATCRRGSTARRALVVWRRARASRLIRTRARVEHARTPPQTEHREPGRADHLAAPKGLCGRQRRHDDERQQDRGPGNERDARRAGVGSPLAVPRSPAECPHLRARLPPPAVLVRQQWTCGEQPLVAGDQLCLLHRPVGLCTLRRHRQPDSFSFFYSCCSPPPGV